MKTSASTFLRDLTSGKRTSTFDQIMIFFLAPLARVYSLIQQLRASLYRVGVLKTQRLPRPVVSIGNITVGGTGKTPVTAYIASLLLDKGYKVAVLSRGYGGSLEGENVVVSDGVTIMLSARECGDEPYLLASTVPGLMVVIGTDRYAAGQLALQQLSPDIFLLDDGFQHLRLWRDLNILLLDATKPFGNHWTLPAGLLREPAAAAKRADLIILTRCPEGTTLDPQTSGTHACVSYHRITDLLPLSGNSAVPLSTLETSKIFAFAGIADPEYFFNGLRSNGLNVIATIPFPDHVIYGETHVKTIAELFQTSGADYAITTEKDGVKLAGLPQELAARIMLARLKLTIPDSGSLEVLLLNLLHK